ncbi:aldehyde dehydrogenase family protein [Actinocorallia sp. API 0066]|uniref:aldehyde dehydrogenase family protein n=1 Tax=Actinocorallia sp. API 0066 TaxID=2896846 RepID=UPI001E4AA286|nr:aldehyde dehydrogenase family protein [Actinocorallia sp. API 0066]MCD0453089.1 aldehyde dehydrogenase family protein [Actinocorallia sp. API 0066]
MSTPAAHPAFPAFVSGAKKHLIDGQWVDSVSGRTFDAVNPATGKTLCSVAEGDAADVDLAVRAARRAFEGEWSRWTPHQRRKLMLKIHDIVLDNFDELALIETLDMGAPLSRTTNLREWTSQVLQFFASQCDAVSASAPRNSLPGDFLTLKHLAPVGVVGGIIPWNGPLIGLWWIFGPALATGCTAVLKPAEDASLSVLRVAELMTEAGVPDGVINVVTGYGKDAGQALAEHGDVDRIAFTGSVGTARSIVRASAGNLKRLQLELGGKSPDIVFADADLDKAVPGAAMGVFTNSGQVCVAGTRIFVQRSVHDEFVERLRDFTGTIRVGDTLDPTTQLGPLISERQLERVLRYIDIGGGEGARLAAGGGRLAGDLASGFYVEPTVFAGASNEMTIAREEIFGPVATVIPFDDVDDALRLANDTPYGLAGGLWTRSLSTAHKVSQGINAGTIWVNCYGVLDPSVGFGGHKMSGYGWKGAREHVESFLYPKAVYINLD